MKLTQEQIQEIEYALNKRGLDYIDLKYELLDHIATDIEQLMTEDKTISFDEAFNQAFYKWKDALNNSSSFWLGPANYIPTILLDKCITYIKRYELTLIAGALLIAFSLYPIREEVLSVIKEFDFVIGGVYILYSLIVVAGIIGIKMFKYNTTYSYLFKLKSFPFLLISLQFNNLIFGHSFYYEGTQVWIHIMNFSIHIMIIFGGFYMIRLLQNHFKLRERKVSVS
ncbi:hypothetical protein [Galbibacter orientalis]|uniref:hypothetical protein n=1 Tax=Galbibacter orientalis TaxID=453852 RepID=UPI003080594D